MGINGSEDMFKFWELARDWVSREDVVVVEKRCFVDMVRVTCVTGAY